MLSRLRWHRCTPWPFAGRTAAYALLAILLVTGSGARAATLDVTGGAGVLVYTATSVVVNGLSVSLAGGFYTIDESGESIALGAGALAAGCLAVDADTVTCPESAVTAWSVDLLDQADVADLTAVVEPVTLRGGLGNDVLLGGSGADTFLWLPGDGSDTIDGGSGGDTLDFDGSNVNETIDVVAVGGGFHVLRNIGNVVLQATSIEALSIQTAGGDDVVTTAGLTGTAQSFDGGDPTTAPGDTLLYNANGVCVTQTANSFLSPGSQIVTHVGFETASVLAPCTGLPSTLDLSAGLLGYTAGVGASNALTASLAAGVYTIDDPKAPTIALTAGAIAAGCASVDLNTVTCPRSAISAWQVDLLDQPDTADLSAVVEPVTLSGRQGDDVLVGGAADDTFTWLPGDGSDTLDGGPGADVLDFDGSNVNETIDVVAVVGGFVVLRNIGNTVLQATSIEALTIQTSGGDDTVITTGLADTVQSLDGGTHAGGDTLVYQDSGTCAFLGPASIRTPGLKVVTFMGFESTPTLQPCTASVPVAGPWALAALCTTLATLGALAGRRCSTAARADAGRARR